MRMPGPVTYSSQSLASVYHSLTNDNASGTISCFTPVSLPPDSRNLIFLTTSLSWW